MAEKNETKEPIVYTAPVADQSMLNNLMSKVERKKIEMEVLGELIQEQIARVQVEQKIPATHNEVDVKKWTFSEPAKEEPPKK